MRVILISHTYFPSLYRGKLRHLARMPNTEVHLAAIPAMRTAEGSVLRYEVSAGDTFHQHMLPSLITSHNVLRTYSLGHLRNLLLTTRPHIVHVEVEPHALALFEVLLLREWTRERFQVLFFSWENIFRPAVLPLQLVERFNLRRADAAIVGNSEARDVLTRRGFSGHIRIVPQVGIDVSYCATAPPAANWEYLRRRGPVIGYVGRMVEEKGVVDLSAAFEALPESLGAQLLLVGDGVLRKPIEERLRRRGLDQRVFFTGRIPFQQVPSHLKCMDVLVLPSRTTGKWKEQFGHVLAEAMASGVPVIGSDSGAIPEVVGDAGLIFGEGNAGSLAHCLIKLIGNDTLREDLVLRGKERVACLYADETVAQQTYQFYRDLLG
jgi:glycosyltransferase involved in cell wall biosynthesis